MTALRRMVLASGWAVVLLACGEDVPSAANTPTPIAKKAAPAAAAPVTVAATYQYAYNPLGKRDPFRSPLDELRQSQPGQVTETCSEPLCQWDLDQLILVAVVTGDANPIGMVEDPQGRGYIVKRNTKIGKQGGKVTQILRDSVTVTEFWTAPDGKVNPNPVSMRLKPDAQVVPAMDLETGKLFQ